MSARIDGELGFLFSEAEITRSCVLAKGCALRNALERRVASGTVVNVAPGLYVRAEYWKCLNRNARVLHMIRGLSELHPTWVFCFTSAALVHGFEVSRFLSLEVHIVSSHARRMGPIVHHAKRHVDACRVNGINVTSVVQTVFDCVRYLSTPLALSVADSALRLQGGSGSDLAGTLEISHKGYRGVSRALALAELADERSENGGESYARAIMLEHGVMPPELQVEYVDPFGGGPFRTDYSWRGLPMGDVAGELDGVGKSEDTELLGSRSTRDVLRAERLRESRLTALGLKVARFSFRQVRNVYPLLDILDGFGVPRDERNALDIPAPVPIAGDTRYGWIR